MAAKSSPATRELDAGSVVGRGVALQADAAQGDTRTRGISDAEVAVLQGESGSRERLRASVKSLCIRANAEHQRRLLLRYVFRATAASLRWITSGRVTSEGGPRR